MAKRVSCWVLAFVSLVFFAPTTGWAEAPNEDEGLLKYHTVTTKEGLVFTVPEDMPIENRNGIVAPIPFEEYFYRKITKLESRVAAAEAQLEELSQTIAEKDQNLKVLKSQEKTEAVSV